MTSDDAGNIKINFGKFKGKTLQEIYNMQPDYLKWLAANAKDEVMRKASKMILQSNNNVRNQETNGNENANTSEIDDAIAEIANDENIPF